MKKPFTAADLILLGVLVTLALSSYFALDSISGDGDVVIVEVQDRVVQKLKLNEPGDFAIQGIEGQVHLKVDNGRVAIVEADCPNRICVRTGWRFRSGEVIVCVPNKTIVRILGALKNPEAVTG